jgi:hypothetical protein
MSSPILLGWVEEIIPTCQSASKIDHIFSTAVIFYCLNTNEYIFPFNIQRCFDDRF